MLTIIPSKLCSELFSKDLDAEPFSHLPIQTDCRILARPQEVALGSDLENKNLILYTNVWPITDSEDQLNTILKTASLNSISQALIASLDKSRYRISYPRKGDMDFPAKSVAWVTFNPKLLWNTTMRRCFFHSVSLTMFAALAFDVVFHSTCVSSGAEQMEARRIEEEYCEAHELYPKMSLEIHGYKTAKAPFAVHDPILVS